MRLGHQLRTDFGTVVGFDYGAAFALASASGVPPAAVAEFLPRIEASAVSAMNEMAKRNG